jgi:hypothetical protein
MSATIARRIEETVNRNFRGVTADQRRDTDFVDQVAEDIAIATRDHDKKLDDGAFTDVLALVAISAGAFENDGTFPCSNYYFGQMKALLTTDDLPQALMVEHIDDILVALRSNMNERKPGHITKIGFGGDVVNGADADDVVLKVLCKYGVVASSNDLLDIVALNCALRVWSHVDADTAHPAMIKRDIQKAQKTLTWAKAEALKMLCDRMRSETVKRRRELKETQQQSAVFLKEDMLRGGRLTKLVSGATSFFENMNSIHSLRRPAKEQVELPVEEKDLKALAVERIEAILAGDDEHTGPLVDPKLARDAEKRLRSST